METCFNYCNAEHGFFSSDERRFITRVHKLKEQFPDEVRIIAEPQDNNGCIYCELPTKWLQIRPPKKMHFSDETLKEMADRLKRVKRV